MVSASKNEKGMPDSREPCHAAWGELARMHPRLCPRQVLGVRIGEYAGVLLGLEVPRSDKGLFAFVESDGCFADGVSVSTGCWLGHRTLRLVDFGKVAATFVNLANERAVRIWPRPRLRSLAERAYPDAADRWHAQLTAYRWLPAHQLLDADEVDLITPPSVLLGHAGERSTCARCGEEILNQKHVTERGATLCRSCTGAAYFTRKRVACHLFSTRSTA